MPTKRAVFILFTIMSTQLVGCGDCKPSGTPPSVALAEVNGQCVMVSQISCTCSDGGVLSSCGAGSQVFSIGMAAPGVFPPCPATFSCDNLQTCT